MSADLELCLVLESDRRVGGRIGPFGESGTAFHGWIELMTQIDTLRCADPRPPDGAQPAQITPPQHPQHPGPGTSGQVPPH
jgi:hypothetical protein